MARRQLAVHRTVVVVDVEGFGDRRRTNAHQVAVRAGLYRALRQAFGDADVSWGDCDHEDRGDGVFILAPADIPKVHFAHAVPAALVTALGEHNATHQAEEHIRLRMVLHAGEVAYDEHGVTAAAVNLAFRLLDANPLKIALAESPGVLALITSEWFFDEVVRHSPECQPTTYRPVRVAVKETSTVGWVSLPDHPYPSDVGRLSTPPPEHGAESVPRQLPAAPRPVAGRVEAVANLTTALDSATRDGTVVIATIAGSGGMGKTWLALHWAHQLADRFPDGQLFVDLRGFSPDGQPMSPGLALRGFLQALGVEPAQIPVELHAQSALYRSLVAGKRMLIVLDNAIDTTQVLPLLPGSPTAKALVTSRTHLTGLITGHGARHLPLDMLTDTEARALLTTRLGANRIAAEPAAFHELLTHCGGFPLALSIIAGRVHTHPHLPLANLAAELDDAALGALDGRDPAASLPTVLFWSYRALTDKQAKVFRLLGIAPGPDISLQTVASLAGLPTAHARMVLRELERASLIGQDCNGRYRMHDLIRRYAADRSDTSQTEVDRNAVLLRVIDFYLHTAHTADGLLNPHRPLIQFDPPAAGCNPLPLPDPAAAVEWFEAEHSCLLATQQVALKQGWHQAVWRMAWTLNTFHYRRGHRHDDLAVWQAGLVAAAHLADPTTLAHAHRLLGYVYARMGRHSEALDDLQRALTLAEQMRDRPAQAHAHRHLGWMWGQRREYRRALEHADSALQLFRTLDAPVWEATALNNVGWYAACLGECDQARRHCEAALILHRRHHYRQGEAATLDSLGKIAHINGQHTHAVDCYQGALTLRRDDGNIYGQADTLDRLGHPLIALGQLKQACAVWREARRLYQAQHRASDADRVQQQLDALDRESAVD